MKTWWMLGVVSVVAASGCAAIIGLRDDYAAEEGVDAGLDGRVDDGAVPPSDGALTDGSVTDALADGGPTGFCARAALGDSGTPLFCADFDDAGEAGAGFETVTLSGDGGIALATTPSESPPRSLMVTLPASLAFQQSATLKKDVALAASRATLSFSWRVESLADAPDTFIAEVRTTSPNLINGVGLSFASGKVRLCNAAPVDIVPAAWHKAEFTVVSGAMTCAMDGATSVVSTNGPVSIVGLTLGTQRFNSPIDASLQPAIKVFFDNVLVTGP